MTSLQTKNRLYTERRAASENCMIDNCFKYSNRPMKGSAKFGGFPGPEITWMKFPALQAISIVREPKEREIGERILKFIA